MMKNEDDTLLPDGTTCKVWCDETRYEKTYHVGQTTDADDGHDGTVHRPFRTINRAAAVAQPGEKIVVHAGLYRECVRPPRGGTGPDAMIAYEAAEGEEVVISATEPLDAAFEPSRGWALGDLPAGVTVWMAALPVQRFGGYNPFLARNVYDYLCKYGNRQDPRWMERVMLRRGTVYCDGQPLEQVLWSRDLAARAGTFWVEEPGTRVHLRPPDDRDPASCRWEVSAREQAFAPDIEGLGYVRVSGFVMEKGADGLPVPQRGSLSTTRGHHWIIENNRIRQANAVGMDIGNQSWDAAPGASCGHHVVRGNVIADCGVCGLAGARGVRHSLIEGNTIERIGGLNVELMAECAAIKFHHCEHSLIRGNTIRHIRGAGAVWLDYTNVNCRITGNTFADVETQVGAVYSEQNPERNRIDHNVFWDIRCSRPWDAQPRVGNVTLPVWGSAVRADGNENLQVDHNFFGKVQAYAVAFSLQQASRAVRGRTVVCRANRAEHNVFFQCPHRIHLGRREENVCDHNLYDRRDDALSFHIAYPEPACRQNLAGWQEFFGLDLNSRQTDIDAEFDAAAGQLTWREAGK